jgi:hypothetical protein
MRTAVFSASGLIVVLSCAGLRALLFDEGRRVREGGLLRAAGR